MLVSSWNNRSGGMSAGRVNTPAYILLDPGVETYEHPRPSVRRINDDLLRRVKVIWLHASFVNVLPLFVLLSDYDMSVASVPHFDGD